MKHIESEDKNNNFQEKPIWIFITLIIILIGAAPAFSELFLDFFPNLKEYQGWVKLIFIIVFIIILGVTWWREEQKRRNENISEDEQLERNIKKAIWITWKENVFRSYPLNIIKFRIIPLFICWIISLFINKKYKSCLFHPFDFPKYWKKYNYEEIISKFFKSMFRVYIGNLNQSYEIKFQRDFQHIELRWMSKDDKIFSEPKNELYEKIFSEDRFKHIEIFTWIFPFGLYWKLKKDCIES